MVEEAKPVRGKNNGGTAIGIGGFLRVYVDRELDKYYLDPSAAFSVGMITYEEYDEYDKRHELYEISKEIVEVLKERFTIDFVYIDRLNDKDFNEYEETNSEYVEKIDFNSKMKNKEFEKDINEISDFDIPNDENKGPKL